MRGKGRNKKKKEKYFDRKISRQEVEAVNKGKKNLSKEEGKKRVI